MPGINIILDQDQQPEDVVVRIEIEKFPLLPDINVMGEEKKLKEIDTQEKPQDPDLAGEIEELIPENPEQCEELVKVINPQDEAILRYQDMVRRKIQQARKYPRWAKKQEYEGTSFVAFTLLSNGMIEDVRIVHSSGFDLLDQEAISTVKRASPFKPIPEKFNRSTLKMKLAIVFQLQLK